ncbi:hypothetical protein HRbin40_01188 [bacterium HR40]|nr:hypothetical protein HRbin40_01188 [bacterium HR40]
MSTLFEAPVWPAFGLLPYATATQVPLTHLPEAFRDRPFMGAVRVANLLRVPFVVRGLLVFLPHDPSIRLGVLLVLLVPCADRSIAFTHLGRGGTRPAIAATPVDPIGEIALLPIESWLFLGQRFVDILAGERSATVFVLLVLLPLSAASLTERWARHHWKGAAVAERLAWFPVPLLALVVFPIAASQVRAVVVVLQSSVGLFGMVADLSVVPGLVRASEPGCT